MVGLLTSRPGFCFFHFVLRFWNQILICVSVRFSDKARLSLSHTDRYRVVLNLFSRATSCSYVKAVLARRGFPPLEVSSAEDFKSASVPSSISHTLRLSSSEKLCSILSAFELSSPLSATGISENTQYCTINEGLPYSKTSTIRQTLV